MNDENNLLVIRKSVLIACRLAKLTILLVLVACASIKSSNTELYSQEQWVVLPMFNDSADASAARISVSMIEANLRTNGVNTVHTMPNEDYLAVQSVSLQERESTLQSLLDKAKNTNARYAIGGTVKQWGRSKLNGRDSRVQLSLAVYDLASGSLIWRHEHAVSGRGSSSVSKVGNKTIVKLVNNMGLVDGEHPDTILSRRELAVDTASSAFSTNDNTNLMASSVGFRTVGLDSNGFADAINRELIGKSIAIYYGANPPTDELSQFDRLVLEPDNVNQDEFADLTEHGAIAYAYLSVGEVGPTRQYANEVEDDWILGKNEVWNSKVLDLTNPNWTEFLMRRIDKLVQAGYTGLFLDTMDSYQIYANTPEQKKQQEMALGTFVELVTKRHTGIRLIANRGFEVLEQTGRHLEAIAAESLFASWDNTAQRYVDVPASDRQWLLNKLNAAKKRFGLDVIAIEYLPPDRREEARQVASSVANLGFTPWVSTPALDYVGVGALEVMPRKIIMLFDSRVNGKQAATEVHDLVAPLIEYYGYVPVYIDLATQELPTGELKGKYAGIVIDNWFSDKLGISVSPAINADTLKTVYQSSVIGFEKSIPARISDLGFSVRNTSAANEVHLTMEDSMGHRADLVLVGEWGGFASSPAAANLDVDENYHWVTDPFVFLEKSLRLQKLPMPDVTTENGKRLWSAHIDGDALPSWAEMPVRKLGAEIIHEAILERFNMPHSISIVEAEMTSIEAYNDRRDRMFDVARRLFAMPSVEIATHSFSHPFNWEMVAKSVGTGRYNLDVGDYQFSAEREIGGSARFINEQLAPANKRTKLMLWTGDALPQESALAAAHSNGLINLNGGFTTISKATPTVSLISPMARTVGPYIQAYAPIMNENVYTDDWRGPFDGFRRVIETFKMTDKPRRFKPISIYYHFYAGTKRASLRSLEEIYEWTTKQDILPVHASYYASKVPHFRSTGVARYLDGNWKLSALGSIKSVRILDRNKWPDMSISRGIIGSRQLHDGMYLHTDGSKQVVFKTTNKSSDGIQLVSANGYVKTWKLSEQGIEFRISGEVPLKVELSASARGCAIRSNTGLVRGNRTAAGTTLFTFSTKDTGNAILNCQA